MTRRVVITGAGVISCLGIGKEAFYSGLVEGRHAFSLRSFNDPERFLPIAPLYGGFIEDFLTNTYLGNKGVRTLSRESQIFLSAAVIACHDAGLDLKAQDKKSVGIFTGTTSAGLNDYVQMFTDSFIHGVGRINPAQGPQTGFNAPASQLSIYFGIQGPNLTMNTGRASGIDVLSYSADHIRDSRVDVVLAGGIETLSYFAVYAHMSSVGGDCPQEPPRPFDAERKGAVLAEAGVVLIVEDYARANSRGAHILAEILGAGSAFQPDVFGDGLETASRRAILQSLDCAAVDRSEIDVIFASGSGDRICDAAEMKALWSVFGDSVPVYAVKGSVGECLGASGVIQVAAALLSLEEGVIPVTRGYTAPDQNLPSLNITKQLIKANPRRVLVNGLDPGGQAASMVLSVAEQK